MPDMNARKRRSRELIMGCLDHFLGKRIVLSEMVSDPRPDWADFAQQAMHHKIVGLVWNAFWEQGAPGLLPAEVARTFKVYYQATILRNEAIIAGAAQVLDHLARAEIAGYPLKGTVLLGSVYKDFGLRTVHDIDVLVSLNDESRIHEIMTSMGFERERLDPMTHRPRPLAPGHDRVWMESVNNLPPYRMLSNSPFAERVEVDFSFNPYHDKSRQVFGDSVGLAKRSVPVVVGGGTFRGLGDEEFLIQLAVHLYKEAVRPEFLSWQADLNLIKFLDVIAFAKQAKIGAQTFHRICDREGVVEEVGSVFRWTEAIFKDKFSETLGISLPCEDPHGASLLANLWDYDRYMTDETQAEVEANRLKRLKAWAQSVDGAEGDATSLEEGAKVGGPE